jgi:hypothetical protein
MEAAIRNPYASPQYVVIGIDGSRSALQAALWAVDEAVHRDVPLQLVYATDSSEHDPRRTSPSDILLGPSGRAALDATRCTLLICDRRCRL